MPVESVTPESAPVQVCSICGGAGRIQTNPEATKLPEILQGEFDAWHAAIAEWGKLSEEKQKQTPYPQQGRTLSKAIQETPDAEYGFCRCVLSGIVKRKITELFGKDLPMVGFLESQLIDVARGRIVPQAADQDVYLRSEFETLGQHFRGVLTLKLMTSNNWKVKIITDAKLRDIYVGNTSAKQKTWRERETADTAESLEEAVGGCNLLILRLGFFGYKNQAASGVVHEALMVREALHKPTWLVEEPSRPWDDNSPSWSQEVVEYLRARSFRRVTLTAPRPVEVDPGLSLDDDPPPTPRTQTPPRRTQPTNPQTPRSTQVDLSIVGPSTRNRRRP